MNGYEVPVYRKGDPLPWLLEVDHDNPGVRYFALRTLLDQPADAPEVCQARAAIMTTGPVPAILNAQSSDGAWVEATNGYQATFWQLIFLAALGADPSDERVQRGCGSLLRHALASNGAFAPGARPVPSKALHCYNGDLLSALFQLGYGADPRVRAILAWQSQAITGEGEVRYYASGTSGPGFACAANLKQPCAWGATKALKALSLIPTDQRSPTVQRAIEMAAAFLLSCDPAVADYPYTQRINTSWFKFGFPLGYQSDVLETVMALVTAGYGADPRLSNAISLILSKQDDQGRWPLERSLNGKMWIDIEQKGKPSKWITLRALRVLKAQANS